MRIAYGHMAHAATAKLPYFATPRSLLAPGRDFMTGLRIQRICALVYYKDVVNGTTCIAR
jgi:hypothetical protein